MFVAQSQIRRAGDTDSSRSHRLIQFELDVVGIPAIGADPEKTWGRRFDTQWLGPRLQADFPKARILLWDHLLAAERTVEPNRDEQQPESDAYQDAARKVSRMRIQDWADRLLEGLEDERANMPVNRPIVFISHSTGGLVLKEALCRSRSSTLVKACLGITFFATPHHGSNILSLAACADTVKDRLGLKWPLGNVLREQLAPQSPFLELLNQKFSLVALGIEVWSYCEEGVLALEIHTELLPKKFRGKKRLQLSDPVVDKRSAYMTTGDNTVTVEAEEMFHISANHVTLPRLEDDEEMQREYIEELGKLINEKNARERSTHQRLINLLQDKVKVSIYEFYNEKGRKLNPVTALPPRHMALADFLNADFELGQLSGLDALTSLPLIVTDLAAFPAELTTAPVGTRGEYADDIFPSRGRTDHLLIKEKSAAPRRLSDSRTISRSRSRHRSLQIEMHNNTFSQAVSGQRIDSILLSGSNAPPQKEAPFVWVHTPFCVSSWVPQVMSVTSHKKQIPNLHWRLLAREHWLTHHNRARHAALHAQYVRSHFQSVSIDQSSSAIVPGLPPPPTQEQIPDRIQFALFLPFLHWDTFSMQKKRADLIKRRDKQDNPHHVDPDLLNSNNLEHIVLWQYLLSDSPVHSRRSLDQYGYPALRNTEVRDADQVLYKKTRSHNQEDVSSIRTHRQLIASRLHFAKSSRHKSEHVQKHSERPPTVLTVDSLWMWILRQDTLVSFASKRQPGNEDIKMSRQADLAASVHHAARQDKLKDCYDLAALIVNKCVTTLLNEADDPHLQVFHIFEEYLSDLTENYTTSFKAFRNLQRLELTAGRMPEDPDDIDPTDTYASRKDLFHLFELRDISDELTTIRKLLTEQQKQVTTMRDDFESHLRIHGKAVRAVQLLTETLDELEGYIDTVDTMLKSSDAMQKSYEKLLDMKTAKVNVDEAHATRMQTEVSTQQSKAITVFTLVTIVFSPLSFMASIFSMNVREWSSVPTNPDLWWVLKILGSVSLAVIILAILVAFNRFTRALVRWAWEWFAWIFVAGLNLVGLGWLAEAIHDGFIHMFSRLPHNPFTWSHPPDGTETPQSFTRSSTLLSTKSSATRRSRTESSLPPRGSFWRRHRQRRDNTYEMEEVVEHLKQDSDEVGVTSNASKASNGAAVATVQNRVPTFGNRAPRVPVFFNNVVYDRQARFKATEEPSLV